MTMPLDLRKVVTKITMNARASDAEKEFLLDYIGHPELTLTPAEARLDRQLRVLAPGPYRELEACDPWSLAWLWYIT